MEWAGLEEAGSFIYVFVLFPVMLGAILPLPHLCNPAPSLGLATVCACCSGRNVSVSPVLGAVYSLLCNLTLVLLPLLLGPSGFSSTMC